MSNESMASGSAQSASAAGAPAAVGSAVQQAAFRRPASTVRRVLVDVALTLCAIIVAWCALTVGSLTHGLAGASKVVATGLASVEQCTRDGPVSRSGFGYWYSCRAKVRWRNGYHSDIGTRSSVLKPTDIGHSVSIDERQLADKNGSPSGVVFERTGVKPMTGGTLLTIVVMIIASVFFIRPVVDFIRLVSWVGRRFSRK